MSSAPASVRPAPWGADREGMSRSERWGPEIPPAVIAGVALLLAVIAGRFFADGRITLGAGIALAVCYAPLVFLDLAMALAVYVAILFVQDTAALSIGPNTMGVLVFLGWVGTIVTRRRRPTALREQPRLVLMLALFVLWLTLSLTWAENPGETAMGLQSWLIAVAAFVVTATTVRSMRDVKIIAVAFIVGAVLSVLYGIESGALSAAVTSASETSLQGRFTGGGGDPNVQAAGFMIGMFLCAGLWGVIRGRLARLGLLLSFVIITIGFFSTQSRGGLLSLAFAATAGVLLLPLQRKRLLALAGAACVGLGIVSLIKPAAIARMTDFGGGTSGRSDIWKVAWSIFNSHPWTGIGLSNFQIVEPRYTLKVGTLARVELIAESPHLVHNVYLQLLAETGVVGLLLFVAVMFASLRSSWLAAQRFDVRGRVGHGDLARAVLMASIAMLVAQVFISDGYDWRMWILIGLGPALLSIAHHTPIPPAPAAPTPRASSISQ